MEFLAGLIATLAIVGLGYATRQARSLSFYSTVLIVIALGYVLFAAMAGTPRTILVESAIAAVFVGVAVGGVRSSSLRVAAFLLASGLAAHGAYDLVHPSVVSNPVVPDWWPLFCGVVDLLMAGWVLFVLGRDEAQQDAVPSGSGGASGTGRGASA
jgi:hypothetical protein